MWGICGHMYRLLQQTNTSLSLCFMGGGTPLYRLYWYEHTQRVWVLEILVRNRVSKWSFWSEPWKGGPHRPAHFFSESSPPLPMGTRLCVLRVPLSTFDGSWCSMDDNFFENGVLFTQYLTLIFHLRYQSNVIRKPY